MDIYTYQYALFSSDKLLVISMCSICMRTDDDDDDVKLVQYLFLLSVSSFALVIVHMYVYMYIWLQHHFMFTTFSPLSRSLVLVHVHFYVYAIRCLRAKFYRLLVVFFYGLKFCASKGRSNVLVRLSSRRAVYTRSADGMSSENSLSPFLVRALSSPLFFRSPYNNP